MVLRLALSPTKLVARTTHFRRISVSLRAQGWSGAHEMAARLSIERMSMQFGHWLVSSSMIAATVIPNFAICRKR